MVLVELKLGEFEPQDKGQVELYLRWLEQKLSLAIANARELLEQRKEE